MTYYKGQAYTADDIAIYRAILPQIRPDITTPDTLPDIEVIQAVTGYYEQETLTSITH